MNTEDKKPSLTRNQWLYGKSPDKDITQSHLIVKEEDCKHDFGRDNCPKSVNECRTGCKYLDHQPVARLIEHTAEKGDVYTIYKNGQLMKPDPNFNPINIRCSPEIDKEEERKINSEIEKLLIDEGNIDEVIRQLHAKFTITRKPLNHKWI